MPRQVLLGLFFLLRGVAFLVLVLFLHTGAVPLMFLGAALAGLASRATGTVFSSLLVNCYGVRSLGTLLGLMIMLHQIAGALGVFAGGLAYDITGSFTGALLSGVVLLVVGAIASWRIADKRAYGEAAPLAESAQPG